MLCGCCAASVSGQLGVIEENVNPEGFAVCEWKRKCNWVMQQKSVALAQVKSSISLISLAQILEAVVNCTLQFNFLQLHSCFIYMMYL